jgi:hypothetical protein
VVIVSVGYDGDSHQIELYLDFGEELLNVSNVLRNVFEDVDVFSPLDEPMEGADDDEQLEQF